jgi:N-acetyl-anhydromuramyl-L-alanine amidase AmpD
MAQSTEYPDLVWVPPKSWRNANRPSVQLIVIHTTEGSAHATSAEDGAAYDARRTDGTSTHFFHDSSSTVQCVRTEDIAHTARTQGNLRGIHHELCARTAWTDTQWATEYARAMLARAARQAARDAKKWGIPVRHLTVAQVADGQKGFCSHWDITRAFPQDGGTHTDPGPNFPWSNFLDMVRAELEGDDMPISDADVDKIVRGVWGKDGIIPAPGSPKPGKNPDGTDVNTHWSATSYLQNMYATAVATRVSLQALPGAVAAELADEDGVDGAVVQAAVERALGRLQLTVKPDA